MQLDNDLNILYKSNPRPPKGKDMGYFSLAKALYLNPAEHAFLKDKTEGTKAYKHAATEDSCSKGLAKQLKERNCLW